MVSKTILGDHAHAQCQFKRVGPRSAAVTFSVPLTLSLSLPRHFPVPVPLQTHLLSPPTELTFPPAAQVSCGGKSGGNFESTGRTRYHLLLSGGCLGDALTDTDSRK